MLFNSLLCNSTNNATVGFFRKIFATKCFEISQRPDRTERCVHNMFFVVSSSFPFFSYIYTDFSDIQYCASSCWSSRLANKARNLEMASRLRRGLSIAITDATEDSFLADGKSAVVWEMSDF